VAHLTVSNNGKDFSESALSLPFYWDSSVIVTTITPSVMYESGGQLVQLIGAGFYPSYPNVLLCRFGGKIIVSAMYTTRQLARCIAPPLSPGNALNCCSYHLCLLAEFMCFT
jgi:hypothetical protein